MTLLDSDHLISLAAALPDHIELMLRAARGLDGLPTKERVENVVVLGMGDSGIAGDILVAAASPFMPVPVTVVRSYEIPAYVGEGSLVFALSFSGNTEEVIEAAGAAAVQGAKLVVVASGGKLADMAGGWGAPVVRIPKDIPQARGALAVPALVILEEIGLFVGAREWINLAIEQLQKRREELTTEGNVAQQIAAKLAGKYVVVQGGGAMGIAAAEYWKSQINQRAKQVAFSSVQPELCHNEVAGWETLSDRNDFAIVCLRHDDEHPQVTTRFELINEHVAKKVSVIKEVHAEGDGTLAQLLDLVMIGDFLALHLARQNNVEPEQLPFMTQLKATLQAR